MADRDLLIRPQAINGHVPVLHPSPAHPGRTCSHTYRSPRKLKRIPLSRPISKPLLGRRLSAELALSAKRTRLQPYHLTPLPMAQLQPPSLTPMMSLTVSCDKKTTLSHFSTRNYSTCAFPSPWLCSVSFHLKKARGVCLLRHWSGIYDSV